VLLSLAAVLRLAIACKALFVIVFRKGISALFVRALSGRMKREMKKVFLSFRAVCCDRYLVWISSSSVASHSERTKVPSTVGSGAHIGVILSTSARTLSFASCRGKLLCFYYDGINGRWNFRARAAGKLKG
jgi:hypothetical protein